MASPSSTPTPTPIPSPNDGVMPPPPGVQADFSGAMTDLQIATVTVFACTFLPATLFMIMRLWTSARVTRRFELNDVVMVLAWGTTLAFFIFIVLSMPFGWGKHLWNTTNAEILQYYNNLIPITMTYVWAPTILKLSLVLTYITINPGSLWFRIANYTLAFVLIAYTSVLTGLLAGPCNPIAVGSGECLNDIAVAQSALNILTEAALVALPIPMVHRLQMPLRQRVAVGLLLTLGSLALVASIGRTASVQRLKASVDFTHAQASVAVWSLVELNVGLACANLARLKPFFRMYLPRLASLAGMRYGSNSRGDHPSGTGGGRSGNGGGGGGTTGGGRSGTERSYQLHSVQKESNRRSWGGEEELGVGVGHGGKKGIHVVDEFRVVSLERGEGNLSGNDNDNSSTDSILHNSRTGTGVAI